MRSNHEFESARQARRSIGLIRNKLLKPAPEVLESCTPHLRVAIEAVRRLHQDLAKPPGLPAAARAALASELTGLKRDLAQVTALVRGAANFYGTLARLLEPPAETMVSYTLSSVVVSRPAPTMRLEA